MLTAAEGDGLTADGRPFADEVRLAADRAPAEEARVAFGEKRLFTLVREGVWGVRVYDPGPRPGGPSGHRTGGS
ncbi:hypothetical protein [Streptomyces sp. NPDC048192]|uniref:hypothetical protein n=1 Tax=unclassified Streptomyces TaxID=2593676 RepID=UPI00371230F2